MQTATSNLPNDERIAVVELARDLLTLEAKGSRDDARALLEQMAQVRPEVQRVLDKLQNVPVDVFPRFVTAEKLLAEEYAAAAPKSAPAPKK